MGSAANVNLPSVAEAARMLARLGFELVHGEQHGGPGGATLLVALRDKPTLEHFDPERIDYWVVDRERGRPALLDRRSPVPYSAEFAWGTIKVVDRLEVANTFLTFGGRLSVEATDGSAAYAIFGSPAPILRWTGHSQDVDPLAAEVRGFFARMMIPIDFTPGAEGTVALTPPITLYSAVLWDLRDRLGRSEALRAARPDLQQAVASEARRIESLSPADWEAGRAFRQKLGLLPG